MRQNEGTVTFSCKAAKYFLETYAKDDFIANTDAYMKHLMEPLNRSPTEYAKSLENKVLQWDRIYQEYVRKVNFIEGWP